MADDDRYRSEKGKDDARPSQPRYVPYREEALADVEEEHGDRGCPSQDPKGVGGTEITAAMLTKVDAAGEPAHDEARRNGAYQVARCNDECYSGDKCHHDLFFDLSEIVIAVPAKVNIFLTRLLI